MTALLLIGCGNMGRALLARWAETLAAEFSPIIVVEPNAASLPKNISQVKQISELPEAFAPGVVVLAVKPQSLESLLPEIGKKFGNAPTYLSIAAGKTLGFYESILPKPASIVRSMPNTPAMVGEGMTALIGNGSLSAQGKSAATKLMSAVGETVWLESEDQMDAVTAISGSGPAYFFTFMANLVEAAVKNGLAPEVAEQLVKQTAMGAAKLAKNSSDGLCTLTKNVTSPGGTTAAALAVFENGKALENVVNDAVSAAIKRAREL